MVALTDPHGAGLYNYYQCGELKPEESSVAEGIGQNRITANLEGAPIDTQFRISDAEGLGVVRRLLDEEGLCLGLSSGINVAGAMALARQLGPGKRIATILRSEEHTSELQSLMRISYAVFCLKTKQNTIILTHHTMLVTPYLIYKY